MLISPALPQLEVDAPMNNATFTALGAAQFFGRYPVLDLSPVKDVILPGKFARFKSKFTGEIMPPQQRDRLTLAFKPQALGRLATAADLQTVDQQHRVQYFDIVPPGDQGALHTLTALDCPAESRPPVSIKLRSDAAHTSIPLFYLPYALNCHRRMTLVDKQGVGGAALFLTDPVDGCSVYVEGTRQAPTVSHLNANSEHMAGLADLPPKTQPVQRKADWSHKADHMHNRYAAVAQSKRVAAGAGLTAARRVDYKHYGMRLGADEMGFEASLPALQLAHRAPTTIGGAAVATMELMHAAGTVFGLFFLGHWTFYVQRRALVTYSDGGGTALGRQWIIRDVQAFWPAAVGGTGKAA